MHLTRNSLTNAVALAVGMVDAASVNDLHAVAHDCGAGVVEFYEQVGQLADLVTRLEEAGGVVVEGDFPGVYAYEVTELVGELVMRALMDERDWTDEPTITFTILAVRTAYEFFTQNEPDTWLPRVDLRNALLKAANSWLGELQLVLVDAPHVWSDAA